MAEAPRSPSQHPVDRLIVEIIFTARRVSEPEVAAIVNRMATAAFNARNVRVPVADRHVVYQGRPLGARTDALTYHFVKRLIKERQWSQSTTPLEYIADLSRATRHPTARLGVYERRGDAVTIAITQTDVVVLMERWGQDMEANLVVVYSATHGIIRTGYMSSSLRTLDLPSGMLWLK
ncbi:MAG: hypothetical protein IT307_18215 [Chloroflexi bacterium]|nr:hypothetical protein [Chloroflexota bacterium]